MAAPVLVPTGVPFLDGQFIGIRRRRGRQRPLATMYRAPPGEAAWGVGAAPLLQRRWGRDRSTGFPRLVGPRGDPFRTSSVDGAVGLSAEAVPRVLQLPTLPMSL